ncbi:hypothetical protein [Frankia sp. QA3]|uniref:hypothetical protein n=1 Tax=Frankia sp. QA3 TaxID=710111 RepID=UPI000269CFA8|nr:hypothetical protein [Frankia sp. QA3]EIV96365.1 hypothetical protein FraQA3DRAFT_6256 [Frankia sp. QA3]
MNTPPRHPKPEPPYRIVEQPLLPLRTAVVLLLAVVAATAAGGLSWLARSGVPTTAMTVIGVFGAAITFFDRHLEHTAVVRTTPEDR